MTTEAEIEDRLNSTGIVRKGFHYAEDVGHLLWRIRELKEENSALAMSLDSTLQDDTHREAFAAAVRVVIDELIKGPFILHDESLQRLVHAWNTGIGRRFYDRMKAHEKMREQLEALVRADAVTTDSVKKILSRVPRYSLDDDSGPLD